MAEADSKLDPDCPQAQPNFSRSGPASGVKACLVSKCLKARQDQDALTNAVSQRTKSLIGESVVQNGTQPGDFGTQLRPGEWTSCQNQAADMSAVVRRYHRYRDALPSARAANDVSILKDDPGSKSKGASCLTRLPDDAAGLNKALGLQPGTITDSMLRNDKTGFRAAIYRDESTEPPKLILVPRDTEAHSLVDWKTNIDNGNGRDSDQYFAMRKLAKTLRSNDVPYDVAGYSKGGGLAQEAGLVSTPESKVYLFNSAGLSDRSLGKDRTGATSFDALANKSSAFSAEGDFLTYMNTTTDPNEQIANAKYLRDQLAKSGSYAWQPVGINYRNPETLAQQAAVDNAQSVASAYYQAGLPAPSNIEQEASQIVDPNFSKDKQTFISSLDLMIKEAEQNRSAGRPFRLFPPVRANNQETIPDSMSLPGRWAGASKPEENIGRLYQHQMSQVLGPMESTFTKDAKAMCGFLKRCG